jgi:ribosomal protein S18 acetylase RimI-like enzyme
MELTLTLRPALSSDRHAISNLIYFETHVHRHLDWRMPLDWLGSHYYWVAEQHGRVVAALSCAPDPATVAWVRLFACAAQIQVETAWEQLWHTARLELAGLPGAQAAVIVLQPWFVPLLLASGFSHPQDIVVLDRDLQELPQFAEPDGFSIRPMLPADLPAVAAVDAAAFAPLWQNSLPTLEHAFEAAGLATVAVSGGEVIAYQITTLHSSNAHLARLAVRPAEQRRRVAHALVQEMMAGAASHQVARVTVNTQSDNDASLALYHQLGFQPTGERYEVYSHKLE